LGSHFFCSQFILFKNVTNILFRNLICNIEVYSYPSNAMNGKAYKGIVRIRFFLENAEEIKAI